MEGGCFEGGNMVEVMFLFHRPPLGLREPREREKDRVGKKRRKSGRVVPSSLLQAWTDHLIPLLIDGSAVACPSLVLVMTSSLPKYFVKLQCRVPTLWINTSEIHQWANNPAQWRGALVTNPLPEQTQIHFQDEILVLLCDANTYKCGTEEDNTWEGGEATKLSVCIWGKAKDTFFKNNSLNCLKPLHHMSGRVTHIDTHTQHWPFFLFAISPL